MHPLINIATKAALSAGKLIIRFLDKMDAINISAKEGNDFVTDIDKLAEQEIIKTIKAVYPDHAILAEESGAQGDNDYCWIIDPLDGTINYIHGIPYFSVSIAVKYKNKIEHALVYNPLSNELFTATRGDGTYLNNRRLRVSKEKTLRKSLLASSLPFKKPENLKLCLALIERLFVQASGVRHFGSAALNLAYVAAGHFDGLFALNQCAWDIAAGVLLVQEAGGLLSDFSGGEDYLKNGDIIAGNPKIFKLVLQEIQPLLKNMPYIPN